MYDSKMRQTMTRDNKETERVQDVVKETNQLLTQSSYAKKAMELFTQGYNCAQSVFLAFQDLYDMEWEAAARVSSSFGGGMGRLREVCGSVSGMFMVAGILYGYDKPEALDEKTEHYKRIQKLAAQFQEQNGSFICRELLGLGQGKDSYIPSERTAEYYKKRPCKELVGMAAALMEQHIEEMKRNSVYDNRNL